jgi:hypothetical protein
VSFSRFSSVPAFTTPPPSESRSEGDFDVVSPVSSLSLGPSALDLLVLAAGLEAATRPPSPVPVEQLSPLTLAPTLQPLTVVSSPTAPPSALFPFPQDPEFGSPIDYERVAPQLHPHSPIVGHPVGSRPVSPDLQYPSPSPVERTPVLRDLPPSRYSPSATYDSEAENRPPVRVNFFQVPPCARVSLPRTHPHQYQVLRSLSIPVRENWRPLSESGSPDIVGRLPIARDLTSTPPSGSYVTPFRLAAPHASKAHPTDRRLAERHGFSCVTLCSRLGVYPPDEHFPFGRLCYSFGQSISFKFGQCSDLIKLAFLGTPLLLYVHDFLDGRICFIYGYLDWTADGLPYATDVSHSYQDAVRNHPFLARFCLFPRLPFDPLAHVQGPPLEDI